MHRATIASLDRRLDRLREKKTRAVDYSRYRADPVGFCKDVLGVSLWGKQVEIAEALVRHRRVLVKSANGVGKSFVAACLALWFYATHDPGICLLTAPTFRQVKDITFKEIRRLYGSPDLYDKMPRIESSPGHYVHGFTTTDATAYQGIHGDSLFVIFEECVGVQAEFWEAVNSILIGGADTYWLAVCNPTDAGSQAYLEEQSGKWHVISVSAFDHPNIALELDGKPPLIPAAVRLSGVERSVADWCQPVADQPLPTDILLKGVWHRPGPIAEARLLGRYPSLGAYGVFSEADFAIAAAIALDWHPLAHQPHVGCDVARFGDDMTCIHVRRGPVSLHHESYNRRDTAWTAGRLKRLAEEFAPVADQDGTPEQRAKRRTEAAKKVPVKVDDAGVGGGVIDQRDGYNFIPVNNACRAGDESGYPNRRSEGLFLLADLMRQGQLSLARLPAAQVSEMKRQAVGITYKLDSRGRRVAEPKADIKKRIGRSPDDLDALVLAYLPLGDGVEYKPLSLPPPRERKLNF